MPTYIKPDLDIYLLSIPIVGVGLLREYDEAKTYEEIIEWVFRVLKKSDDGHNEYIKKLYLVIFEALYSVFTNRSYSSFIEV